MGSRPKADSALRGQAVAPSGEHAAGAPSASRPTARGPPRLGVRSREAGFPSPLPLHSWPWDVLRLVPGAGARMPSSSWAGTSGIACSHPFCTRLSHCHGSRQGVLKLPERDRSKIHSHSRPALIISNVNACAHIERRGVEPKRHVMPMHREEQSWWILSKTRDASAPTSGALPRWACAGAVQHSLRSRLSWRWRHWHRPRWRKGTALTLNTGACRPCSLLSFSEPRFP